MGHGFAQEKMNSETAAHIFNKRICMQRSMMGMLC